MILLVKSYLYHFVHTILSVPLCPIPFCPYTILSIPFCPNHFVRYHFVLEPLQHICHTHSYTTHMYSSSSWFSAFLGRFVRPMAPFTTIPSFLLQLAVILFQHPVQ